MLIAATDEVAKRSREKKIFFVSCERFSTPGVFRAGLLSALRNLNVWYWSWYALACVDSLYSRHGALVDWPLHVRFGRWSLSFGALERFVARSSLLQQPNKHDRVLPLWSTVQLW